jgi:hypothetical protein
VKEQFKRDLLSPESKKLVSQCNAVIDQYVKLGYTLTLRQLHYQLVAKALIPNTERSYKKLGDVVGKARLCGLIDWDAIEDRTRWVRSIRHFNKPQDAMEIAAAAYRMDKWASQPRRIEVWVEKDALGNVLQRACDPLDVPWLTCRGYMSLSELYEASKRLLHYKSKGQRPTIIHLGDHDPSGLDMTRDILERMQVFLRDQVEVDRIALNYPQVQRHKLPPNFAKVSDSRFVKYSEEFGEESWELDALSPAVIARLIEKAIIKRRDQKLWDEAVKLEADGRAELKDVATRWPEFLTAPKLLETALGEIEGLKANMAALHQDLKECLDKRPRGRKKR